MFCKNCGQQIPDGVAFCPNCGTAVAVNEGAQPEQPAQEQNNTYQSYTAPEQNYSAPQGGYSQPVYSAQPSRPSIESRNIATAIILSIVTCGIYSIYWIYTMIRDTNIVTGNEDETTLQVILCLFIPFYSLYWLYTRDKRLLEAGAKYGVNVSDNSVIMLILAICQLGIVSWALLQNDLNNFAG